MDDGLQLNSRAQHSSQTHITTTWRYVFTLNPTNSVYRARMQQSLLLQENSLSECTAAQKALTSTTTSSK